MNDGIVVIAQHGENRTDPLTYESLACAWSLCGGDAERIRVIVPGDRSRTVAREIAAASGFAVTSVESDVLNSYNADAYLRVLGPLLEMTAPGYVILPHTCIGYDLAPALAVKLGAACITGVEAAVFGNERTGFVRNVSAGKLSAEVVPETATAVLTIQPGAWQPLDIKPDSAGAVDTVRIEAGTGRSRTTGFKQAEYQGSALADSTVIVAAGRGIGMQENLALIHDVARLFPRSAIGCSRAVCDAGWLGYAHQVGMTGATVAPKLYFAIGISGAVQHVAGIRDAQMVIAINNDPAARIFARADVGIVEDLTRFIPVLMEEYDRQQGTTTGTEEGREPRAQENSPPPDPGKR